MSAFDKIIGYPLIKEELKQIADCLKNTSKYRRMGVSIPRGLVLKGIPGVGKTLMTMCLVEESGRQAYICRKDSSDGDFVEQICETFEKAEEHAPSIIVLDDMDKFANTEGRNCYAEEYVTVQSCIDSIKGKDVFVVATANDIARVPDSLIRHGRFDITLEIELPTFSDTAKIIDHYLCQKPKVDADTKVIAEILSGKTSATLETVINEAGLLACYEGCDTITTEHIIKAAMRTVFRILVPSDMSSMPTISLNEYHFDSEMVYHEAGHATMCEVLLPDSIALITTISEEPTGGFFKRIRSDNLIETVDEIERKILIGLAGKAAVEVRYGTPGAGAASDNHIVSRYILGLIKTEANYGYNYLSGIKDDSDLSIYHRQQAVGILMTEYYNKAKRILSENRALLDRIAKELSVKRYLISTDMKRIKKETT